MSSITRRYFAPKKSKVLDTRTTKSNKTRICLGMLRLPRSPLSVYLEICPAMLELVQPMNDNVVLQELPEDPELLEQDDEATDIPGQISMQPEFMQSTGTAR